ncbi:MAG: MBL fold metallo-hydrolase [bacterium]
MSGAVRVDRVVTSGTFSLDGATWQVDNNVWLVGDDDEVLVIDAAHSAAPITAAIGHRRVAAIACTHGHDDHIGVAPLLSVLTGAPVLLHPGDDMLWQALYGDRPHSELADGQIFYVGGVAVRVLHTPGHSPGGVCFLVPELETVFSGDTLFKGGPGATGRSYSDFPTIITSIRDRLLTLPGRTVVRTGHGEDTSVGGEAISLQDWIRRGY